MDYTLDRAGRYVVALDANIFIDPAIVFRFVTRPGRNDPIRTVVPKKKIRYSEMVQNLIIVIT